MLELYKKYQNLIFTPIRILIEFEAKKFTL